MKSRVSQVNTQLATATAPEVVEVVVKALQRAGEPLTASKLRQQGLTGPYKLPDKQLQILLEDLVAQGRVHRFEPSKKGGKPRYWTQDYGEYARQVMQNVLHRKGPLTRSQLDSSLKSPLKGISWERLERIRQEMVAGGQIYEWPPLERSRIPKFSTLPPNPRDYLREPIRRVAEQLIKAGVTREQMVQAVRDLLGVPPSDPDGEPALSDVDTPNNPEPPPRQPSDEELGQRILERMVLVVPAAANGALVSLRELWRSMQFQVPDKSAFDRAVLRLAEGGYVALHRHDYPAGLSDEEKAEMIPDGRGSYYIGVARRV